MNKLPLDPFLAGILTVLIIAWQLSDIASNDGALPAKFLTTFAVMGIFYIQGLSLNPKHLRNAATNWRFHLLIQGFIFVAYPIVSVLLLTIAPWGFSPGMDTGIWLLAILPTTISTALVFTSKAGGNSAMALVNITISNFAGILIVPVVLILTCGGVLQEDSNLREIFFKLLKLLVAPFLVGQLNRFLLPDGFVKEHRIFKILSQSFILFILLNSFSNAFSNDAFATTDSVTLIKLCTYLVILLILIRGLAFWICRFIQDSAQRPPIFFCASQKTLAAGLPLATTIFGTGHPELGILLMPVLIYHPIQLAVDGILASRWNAKTLSS